MPTQPHSNQPHQPLEITALGHSAFFLKTETHSLLFDPFIEGNPKCPFSLQEVLSWKPDTVLISHAHGDHWGNALGFALQGTQLIGTAEIAAYAEANGAKNVVGMNIGGRFQTEWGSVKLTPAWHSSSFPDGSYGGMPTGFILEFAGRRIYYAGDTALFSDMQLIAEGGLDLAFLPIGDHYTMGVDDAVSALKLLRPSAVIPMHFGTFPPLIGDPNEFADKAKTLGITTHILQGGDTV